jgi:predicted nucleotidyltransferase
LDANRGRISELTRGYGLRNVRVFGSVAQGAASENSDVDLLIDDSRSFRGSLLALSHLVGQLEEIIGRKVDLVFSDQIKENRRAFIDSSPQFTLC